MVNDGRLEEDGRNEWVWVRYGEQKLDSLASRKWFWRKEGDSIEEGEKVNMDRLKEKWRK